MTAHALATCLLLGLAVLAPSDPFPAYKVAPDTELERVYKSSTKLESEPARMFIDDKEVDSEGRGELRLRVDDARSTTVTDTVRSVADGRPTKFSRTFDEAKNSATETIVATPPGGQEEMKSSTRERTSPFVGKTVTFTWDDSDDEYAATTSDKGLSETALDELTADAEWLPLLGDATREKGAAFEIDAKLFARIQSPLGELGWQTDGKDPEPAAKSLNDQLRDNLSGKAHATWEGSRDVDGRACSVFSLEAQLTSDGEAEFAEGGETRAVEIKLEYTGEIVWDLAAGRVASYAFEGDAQTKLSSTRSVESPNGEVQVRRVFDLAGTSKHVMSVTAR